MRFDLVQFFRISLSKEYFVELVFIYARLIKLKSQKSVHIHAMSVGAYTFAVTQVAAQENNLKMESIKSVVWDSIVVGTEENMKRGIVESTPKTYRVPVTVITNTVMLCLKVSWSIFLK